MPKTEGSVVLIHAPEQEGTERLEALRAAGFQALLHEGAGEAALRPYRRAPPAAFVIDLSRLPSQGRAVGVWLRQQKILRKVPLVFAGGASEKVAGTQQALPDATYCDWENVAAGLQQALESPVEDPVIHETMAGHSGTPLVKKLGIKPDSVVALLGAPSDFDRTLGELPEGVRVRRRAQGRADRVLLFCRDSAVLERRFAAAARAVEDGGGLWLIWPKRSSGVATDLGQPQVRTYGLDRGWVDYKICAVDEVWSGLLFARRT